MRILFVGGCHLNGFPVGKEHAFMHAALRCLSLSDESSLFVLPLVNLRSGSKILAACRNLKPDVVVLQLGHYEAPPPLRKSLGVSSSKKKSTAGTAGAALVPDPEKRYRPKPSTIFAELKRVIAAGTIIAVGRRRKMYDPGAIADSLDSILSSLKELPLCGIVLVGPFSAPDPVMRFFRRRAAPIFEAAARRHSCIYVDVFSFLESHSRGDAFRANFADTQHLSVLGHARVGALVGAALKSVLELSPATDAELLEAKPTREARQAVQPGWAGQPAAARCSPSVGAA